MKSIPADASPSSPEQISPSMAVSLSPGLGPAIWARRLVWILALLAAVLAMTAGVSLLIQHTRLKSRLTARIAAELGRRVEVGSYEFTLWGGPTLEARSISVAEDPRFGQEYFLRAETVSLRLRWRSLLRGHFIIDTLSLTRPSLNLVRNSAGDWNLAEWLPRPLSATTVGAPYPLPRSPALRFRRIEIDGGRINFKRGDDKLPLALIGLTGAADTDASGRWRVDLTATPWRAAVPMQQAGVLHASGYVGGTSSRLRPAKLDVTWSDASISDVLRLARADDYGIRGALAALINAATRDQDDAWIVHARVQLAQLHRWDLALRADNPSANVILTTEWHPTASSLELNPLVLEAPHSSARLSAKISWDRPRLAPKEAVPPIYAELSGSQIDMSDVLSWVRAFHTGIADDASLQGLATVRGIVSGWPVRVVNAVASTDGVSLTSNGLRRPVHLGGVQFRYDHGLISLLPAEISFGSPENVLRVESSAKSGRGVSNTVHVSGSLSDVRDLLAATSALGWELARGSDLAGPVRGDLRWQGPEYPWREPAVGFIEWGAAPGTGAGTASLRAPFLNLPVDQIRARLDLKPGARHITLTSAQAFGARWSGTLDRRDSDPQWQFSLSADRLAAADLDRWLNPRWRQSFLDRMFPFLNSSAPSANAAPEKFRATGRLSLARFSLESLILAHLEANLRIDGREIALENAAAQLGGGAIDGTFSAHLEPVPAYEADIDFARVDLSSITDGNPPLAGLFDGSASGKASFRARGATRADLLASLDCRGSAFIGRPVLRKIDLLSSLSDGIARTGSSRLTGASADFSCAQQVVRLENLSLDSPELDSPLAGSGTIDFSGNLSLVLHSMAPGSPVFRLTGALDAPSIASVSAAPPRRSR
jgi:uncharacterized protein involved in outer membrane biogenesis